MNVDFEKFVPYVPKFLIFKTAFVFAFHFLKLRSFACVPFLESALRVHLYAIGPVRLHSSH